MPGRLLIIGDDPDLRESLQLVVAGEGYEALCAGDAGAALALIERVPFDVVLCDLRMPGMDGMELLPLLARRLRDCTLIMMSACGTPDLAVAAMQRGAYDYLARPFEPSEVLLTLRKAEERERLRRRASLLERDVQQALGERPIVAASSPMIDLLDRMERAAAHKTTVLITGESGTGKEVLARAVHAQSPRRREAFAAVNCAALPEPLLESELFGHVKGAFTGADRARRGLFEEAEGGTLFLDEIAELSTALQTKLLRVLQEEEIRPVGVSKTRRIDVRVIAATARRLEEMLAQGRFSTELYCRLDAVQLAVPPLRERPRDIPLLVDHFFAQACRSLGKPLREVSTEALERLVAYRWPGNVRELENVIERAVILADSDCITPQELPPDVTAGPASTAGGTGAAGGLALKPARRALDADLIRRALRATGGNRTHAARLLEISHRALLYKLKEHEISG